MGKYNFDRYIERRGTDSSKWDGFESRFPGYNASGALPMWVADMDFTAPDEVIDVLKKKAPSASMVIRHQRVKALMMPSSDG